MDTLQRFREAVAGLQGMRCIETIGCYGTGSMGYIYFAHMSAKTFHTPGRPEFAIRHAEAAVSTRWAPWRIETSRSVICSSESSNEIGGPIDEGFACLKGKELVRSEVVGVALDLILTFEDGARMLIFCDRFDEANPQDNYMVKYRGTFCTVECNSSVTYEESPASKARPMP